MQIVTEVVSHLDGRPHETTNAMGKVAKKLKDTKDKFSSFADSIIFIRLILLSIAIYVWIIQERKHLKNLSIIFFITIIFIIADSLYQFLSYDPAMGYGKDIFGFVPKHYGRLTGPFNDQVPGSHLTRFFFISILLFIY